jgi:hypothetical protein
MDMNEIEERIRAAVRPYKASDALAPTPNERGGPAPRRRRLRLAGLVVAVMLVSGTAVASTTSFFTTAPDWVRGIFSNVPEVDEANAIKVGVIDDHGTYAAPADDGGFCLYYAPDIRSGPPSVVRCVEGGHAANVIPLTLEMGGDGGFVVGRVLADGATSVDVTLPGRVRPITTPVRDQGFFVVKLPDASMQAVPHDGLQASLASLSATAKDALGEEIAMSNWDSTVSALDDGSGRLVEIHAPTDSPTDSPTNTLAYSP